MVDVRYDLAPNGQIGFVLGRYDPTQLLIIDPTLTYSTYLGGSSDDRAMGITRDSAGNIYLVGETLSSDFPTQDPPQGNRAGDNDFFITKFTADGRTILFSTYLGGTGEDTGYAIALDSTGNIVVAGETASTNFPMVGALDATFGGGTCGGEPCEDAIVATLTADGSTLRYSTYLGGTGEDRARGVATDSAGRIHVTGFARDGLPTRNAYQASFAGGSYDAFVTTLNPTVSGAASLVYSTYLGGTATDGGYGMVAGDAGLVTLVGRSSSSTFPTSGAYQPTRAGGADVVVTQLDTTASGPASLRYSTFLGGGNDDEGLAIARDSLGRVYITGYTSSSNFPTRNPWQAARNGTAKDAFIAQFDPTTTGNGSLRASTYLGGTGEERGLGIAVRSPDRVYITGFTRSSDFPTAQALDSTFGGGTCGVDPCEDAFVAYLDSAAIRLEFSTYLGGGGDEEGTGLTVDSGGNVAVTGYTESSDFPLLQALRTTLSGQRDAFLTLIEGDIPPPTATRTPTATADPCHGPYPGPTCPTRTPTRTPTATPTINACSLPYPDPGLACPPARRPVLQHEAARPRLQAPRWRQAVHPRPRAPRLCQRACR